MSIIFLLPLHKCGPAFVQEPRVISCSKEKRLKKGSGALRVALFHEFTGGKRRVPERKGEAFDYEETFLFRIIFSEKFHLLLKFQKY